MSFVAAAITVSAGTGLASGIMQSNAAEDAADQQAQAAREANALQERMYNQTRKDNEPYRQAGANAIQGMQSADYMRDFGAQDFQQDPGYAFRMAEGAKALERSAAARGGLNSGRALKAITRYGQDFASNEYQNAYNRFNADRDRRFGRLSNMAGMGQASANQSAAAGQAYAGNAGANLMNSAAEQGAAGMAGAQAWGNTMSGIAQAGMNGVALNQRQTWMDRQLKAQGTQMAGNSLTNYGGYA